jgi:hypothetical protein
MRRLILLAIVIIGLAPVWIRSPMPAEPTDEQPILRITALHFPTVDLGPVRASGAWQLESPNRHFGSYSAMVPLGRGTLLAAADTGKRLRFTPPGRTGPGPRFDFFADVDYAQKAGYDVESLTRDPGSGRIWAGYEYNNHIERYDAQLRSTGLVRPAAMRRWRSNSGPESMVRLGDGRFIVLAETGIDWFDSDGPGLLFPGDPVDGAKPLEFRFRPPSGFDPCDMAALPDGRVLILLRKVVWGLPPRFVGKLMIADPATIRLGERWRAEPLADLRPPLPMDNYEGLAVEPMADGQLALWVISDDNHALLQRTLLLELVWRPNEKARGTGRAPQ